MICRLVAFLAISTLVTHESLSEFRTWTDINGRQVIAEWTHYTGTNMDDIITLRDKRGVSRDFKLGFLSVKDREHVRGSIALLNYTPNIPESSASDTDDPFGGLFSYVPGMEPQRSAGSASINNTSTKTRDNKSSPQTATPQNGQLAASTANAATSLLIIALLSPVAIYGAHILDKKRLQLQPNTRPYKWGYFNGLMSILFVPLGAIILLMALNGNYDDPDIIPLVVLLMIHGLMGFGVIKRNRIMLIMYVIFSFNPVFWIINGPYFYSRWSEMKLYSLTNKKRLLSTEQRIIVSVIVSGVIALLGYGFMEAENITANDLQESWLGWVLVLLVAGLFNLYLFRRGNGGVVEHAPPVDAR